MSVSGTCLSVHSKPSMVASRVVPLLLLFAPSEAFQLSPRRLSVIPTRLAVLRMLAQPPPSTTDVPERQEADAFWEHPGLVRSACEEILVAVENSYGVVPGCVPVKGTAPTPTPTPPQPWPDD